MRRWQSSYDRMQDYEIYDVDFGQGQGHEQSGERPAVIVRAMSELGLFTVVPLTSKMERAELPYTVIINSTRSTNLRSASVALVLNVSTVAINRIRGRAIGKLEDYQVEKVKTVFKNLLKL